MAEITWFVVYIGAFLVLMFVGMPIAVALGVASLVYLVDTLGTSLLNSLGLVVWGTVSSFTLTTMPLFMLMSEILLRGGIGERLYRGMARVVRPLPGGLLQTNVAGCTLFAAISGSSIATAAAIGAVALPQLRERGYHQGLATGTLAAGGTLGILIPPSVAFIVYGGMTSTSIAQLFAAGLVPGLVLAALFMTYVAVRAHLDRRVAPVEGDTAGDTGGLLAVIRDLVPVAVLFTLVLGGIFRGVFTPTEGAAVGVVLAAIVARLFGTLDRRSLWAAVERTIVMTASVMMIVVAASIFSYVCNLAQVPQTVSAALRAADVDRTEFLVLVVIAFLVLGCFMESIGIMVITIPLLYPMLGHYGIDPIWFGVVVVILIEVGMITPPFGMNLFVIQGLRNGGPFGDVVRGSLPFVVIMVGFVGLLALVPELATWLPSKLN